MVGERPLPGFLEVAPSPPHVMASDAHDVPIETLELKDAPDALELGV